MGLKKRGNIWYYRFVYAGRETVESTGLEATERNRKHALSKERERRLEIEGGKVERSQKILFPEAAEQFLSEGTFRRENSLKRVKGSLASLIPFFERRAVHSLTSYDVIAYRTWRFAHHKVKAVTVRHDLHALSKFFRYAVKMGWAKINPVLAEDIPSDKDAVRINPLSPERERRYLIAASRWPKLVALVRLMTLQGCRPEELLSVAVEDVRIDRRYLTIREGKSDAAKRTLRLRDASIDVLKPLLESSSSPWLFSSERDPERKLSLSSVENWHVKTRERSKVSCVIYDFRHTFGTRSAAAGMPLATLAKIMGHSSLRSIMKYVHPAQEEMDSELDALDGTKPGTEAA
jgi:integrase